MYLGYVIGGGELKMGAIMKWRVPINVFEVMIYIYEGNKMKYRFITKT